MITELQQRKFEQYFDRYDVNSDGVIDQWDIDGLIQSWCVSFNVAPRSEQWREVTRYAYKFWEGINGHFDADGDKVISKQEWVAAHDDPNFIEEIAIPLAQATFELADIDKDGRVSLNEWMTTQTVSGVSQLDALEMFQKLDSDGDGFVTNDEHAAAIREFFRSDDPNAVGNQLAGHL